MEAGALRRGSVPVYLEAARAWARARSRTFWLVAGLTLAAAALRFATLGLQSYHHDEVITASRLLRGSFWHAMDAVGFSESAPPLYYALAWLWAQATGTAELGLRSLSAAAGVATVPVAYLIGRELRGARAGVVAAALVAVNPMLLWYSQEARAYSLLVLLCALSLLYCLRADVPSPRGQKRPLGDGTSRDVVLWGVFSALALATHYFAVFPLAVEALWLWRRRGRDMLRGLAILGGTALLLVPLVVHQMSYAHADWIGNFRLGHRLWEAGLTFLLGETGDIIAQPEHPLLAVVPALLVAAALSLLLARGERDERRAASIPLAIAAVTVGVPLLVALLDPGKDFVLARNLLPALVPLLVAVAIGASVRGARRAGTAIAALLVAYSLGFSLWASFSPALQRVDWDSAAAALGEPERPRAVITWTIGQAPLRYYLATGSFQPRAYEGFQWWVGEIAFISNGPAAPPPRRLFGARFRQIGEERVGRLYIRRYGLPGPGLARLRMRPIVDADLGFRSNRVLIDGVGPR